MSAKINFFSKSKKSTKIIILAVLALVLWMLSGLLFQTHKKTSQVSAKSSSYSLTPSQAVLKSRILNVNGVTSAKNKVTITCEVSGEVQEILVKNGQFLKEGDIIIKVDEMHRRELYDSLKLKLQQAEIELRAANSLYAKKLSSESDLAKYQSQVSAVKSDLKKAKIDLDNTKVKAPFDGYIDNISVKFKDYLFGVSVPGNDSVGTFIAAEPMVIKAQIPDKYISLIQEGLKATAVDINSREINGTIQYVSKIMDEASNTFPIEIGFQNSDFKILDGQEFSVTLYLKESKAHSVKQSVLDLDNEGNIGIKFLDDKGIVNFCKVEIIDEKPDSIWIIGCPESMNVISLGHSYIKIGEKLAVENQKSNNVLDAEKT